jgi:alpha-D-xyloside xylohydrolase
MMQSLALALPGDPAVSTNGDEYLFGPDLLVAPVHSEGETRGLVLPRGRWTNLWDGTVLQGGLMVKIHAALDGIPVFLRSGALLPLTLPASLRLGETMTPGSFGALLATPPEAAGRSRQLRRDAETSEYSGEPVANGFRVILSAAPHVRFAIAAGMERAAAKVALDGVEIPHLTEAQISAPPVGWYITEDQRPVVRLPQNVKQHIEISTR